MQYFAIHLNVTIQLVRLHILNTSIVAQRKKKIDVCKCHT